VPNLYTPRAHRRARQERRGSAKRAIGESLGQYLANTGSSHHYFFPGQAESLKRHECGFTRGFGVAVLLFPLSMLLCRRLNNRPFLNSKPNTKYIYEANLEHMMHLWSSRRW